MKADATDEGGNGGGGGGKRRRHVVLAAAGGNGGRGWCFRQRTVMAEDEEACGALPAAVEEEGSGSHLSCFPKYIFYRVTKTLRRQ